MPHQKTSEAVYKTARLNPATNKDDKRVLEIIAYWEDKGFNFKELVVDRLLRGEGVNPAHKSAQGMTAQQMEEMLQRFTDELLSKIRTGQIGVESYEEISNDDTTQFIGNFARGLVNRQKQGRGED